MAKKNKGFRPNKGFLAPLTGKRFRRESKAMAKIRYGPEERRLKQEIGASGRQGQSVRKMFEGYQGRLSESGARQQAGYEQAGQRIGQTSQRASDYAETLRQRLAQEGMADAQRRGTTYDPSGSTLSGEAQLARMASSNILAGVTAAQGASQGAFMQGRKDAARRSSIEQRMAAAARTANLRRERRELGREKGTYRASLRPAARESERNYYLGLLAAKEPGKGRAFQAREAAKGRRFDRKQAGKDRRFDRKHGDSGSGGSRQEGREDRLETRDDIKRLRSLLETRKPKVQRELAYNKGKAVRWLTEQGRSYSAREARRAYKRWRKRSGIYGPFQD